ncbi:IS3 family transposase [Mycolicibacterium gilvum]|uniref:IS3 family transposase n=1 Tax=Mycolicibacterium gilvum TaxID=1804 RepID=UPI0021F3335F|nr:IS3 family transposase [Mycolicibacterium gilvum]MCV7058224.1 IS3 family transposase [Mycolicibacterium gilvum]
MPRKYDDEFKARAVRLVTDHAEEYDTRTACITAVAKRLGVSYESLRRWVNQTEVDTGQRDGVPTDVARENRELKRKNRELEETIEILKAATKFLRAGERPATPLICAFIAEVLTEHGCQIAPRTFYAWLTRPPSARALWDTVITEVLAGFYEPDEHGRRKPESLYGATKMWAHLHRQGIVVARCTVERLMRANGWRGVTRRKKVRTTIADPAAARAADLVKRRFRVPAPNVLLVADFTYVRLTNGTFVYTAFAIDAYAGRIVGWTCSASKEDRFVRQAIRHAAQLRIDEGNPLLGNTIHHSDAGSQYTSVRFGETLALSGLVASIGTVGDAFDNALAETTIGLYKTEAVRDDSPFRRGPLSRLTDVELLTAEWVHWYNADRLMHRLGRIPPLEYEAVHYATNAANSEAAHQ